MQLPTRANPSHQVKSASPFGHKPVASQTQSEENLDTLHECLLAAHQKAGLGQRKLFTMPQSPNKLLNLSSTPSKTNWKRTNTHSPKTIAVKVVRP